MNNKKHTDFCFNPIGRLRTNGLILAEGERPDYIKTFETLKSQNEALRQTSPTNFWAVSNLAAIYSELYVYYSNGDQTFFGGGVYNQRDYGDRRGNAAVLPMNISK